MAQTATPPPAARKHYLWSALLATRAVREARKARGQGATAVSRVIATHQITAATRAPIAVARMLLEQEIQQEAQALLNSAAFTTSLQSLTAMAEQIATDYEFDRLVSSLVQDAARTAESVATAVIPDVGYVRFLNLPSCSRCAVLAGRVYRYSTGFERHPGCDCVMLPTTIANDRLAQDPIELMKAGQVTDLPKADRQAILDGADFGRVVNARLRKGGVRDSGLVLTRAGRPTPAAIYKAAKTRDDAIAALVAAGYVRT
ncbi:hypothetical protein [Nocardioides montaniterrae]